MLVGGVERVQDALGLPCGSEALSPGSLGSLVSSSAPRCLVRRRSLTGHNQDRTAMRLAEALTSLTGTLSGDGRSAFPPLRVWRWRDGRGLAGC